VQSTFQTANANLPSAADEPIAGPDGLAASVALVVADELEDEELDVEELPEPPAAPIAPKTMKTTTIFCQVFRELNLAQIFFTKPIIPPHS
jgi:hypothetical protein